MGRIFSVRVNLDSLAAELAHCETDQERGQWLAGFQAGAYGIAPRQDWSQNKLAGLAFGAAAHTEAQGFIAKQSENGSKSADARRSKYGTAKPVRTTFEPPSNDPPKPVRTTPEPIQHPTSNIQISSSEHPTVHAEEANAFDTGPALPLSSEDRWRYEKNLPWAQAIIAAGGKIGPQIWITWKELLVGFPLEKVLPVLRSLPAEDRWPDRTETALRAQGGQTPIGEAVKYKIRKITND